MTFFEPAVTPSEGIEPFQPQSECKAEVFVEQAPAAIAMFDLDMRYLLASQRWLRAYGLNHQDLVGKSYYEIFPNFPPQSPERHQQCLSGAVEQSAVERLYLPNGSIKWVRWEGNPWRDARGNIGGLMLLTEFISERQQAKALGQLVAGVAHEINNPVNFIYGNLNHAQEYTQDLLQLLQTYQQYYSQPVPEVQALVEALELDFLIEDLPKLLSSMKVGADRIKKIVTSLRNFSRMDESEVKDVDIHEGIDSTLMILQNRLKAKPDHPAVQVIKEYGTLPLVECYAGQLNQVFMNIITNALDAIEERDGARSHQEIQQHPSYIRICSEVTGADQVRIRIADNGLGMSELVQQRLFDPFFTTKSVGKGTGLGMSISYSIVTERHGGSLQCFSTPGKGTELVIEIPSRQSQLRS